MIAVSHGADDPGWVGVPATVMAVNQGGWDIVERSGYLCRIGRLVGMVCKLW